MIQAKHYSVLACLIALFATATTPASAQQPPSQKSNQATALRTAQNPASEQIEARRQRAMQITLPGIDISQEISPTQTVKITARDGYQFEIALRTPPGHGPFPAIIVLHGGMSHTALDRRVQQSQKGPLCTRLLASGYAVVVSTHRTYTDQSRDPGPIHDNVAVIDYLKTRDDIDNHSIVALGNSGGGRICLELSGLGDRTGLAAIVCSEPASTLYAEMYPPGMPGPNMEVSRNPDKYFTEKNQAILQQKIKKISTPILIVHSDGHHINQLNNQILLPELRRQKKQLSVKKYSGHSHSMIWGRSPNLTVETFDKVIYDINQFLAPHLKIKPSPIM